MTEEQGWNLTIEILRDMYLLIHNMEKTKDPDADPAFTRVRELLGVFYGLREYEDVFPTS